LRNKDGNNINNLADMGRNVMNFFRVISRLLHVLVSVRRRGSDRIVLQLVSSGVRDRVRRDVAGKQQQRRQCLHLFIH